MLASFALLTFLTVLNIVGLSIGKWLNNIGAVGTFVAAAVLIGLGITIWSRFGTSVTAADLRIPADPKFVLNSFGVICFGLVGLELASVMGDEIRDPQKTLARCCRMGRGDFRRSLHRCDANAAGRHRQERHQRAARDRARRQSDGGQGWSGAGLSLLSRSCSAFRSPVLAPHGWAGRPGFRLWPGSIPTCRRRWEKFIRNTRRRTLR